MTSAERSIAAAAFLAAALGCGGGSREPLPDTSGNVVPLSVDGAHCTVSGTYVNEPCVPVTVCTPGTQTCQTIEGILLDTGSFGLRIFKQALTVALGDVVVNGASIAECIQYADGSSDWGPVKTAGVVLGGEPAVQVPIQVIDATFAGTGRPAGCANPDPSPASAGFNGILGVGAFVQDCGPGCASTTNNGIYYACTGSTCVATAMPLGGQVTNPVAALPHDNNGIVVKLPPVGAAGAGAVEGSLVLGIGTAQNNAPGSVAVLDLDGFGEFRSTVSGTAYKAFADTGSNALFFAAPNGVSIRVCPSSSSWYCPTGGMTLGATNTGASGKGSASFTFSVADFEQLSQASAVFSNLAGPGLASGGFDWGLPFFLGRPVYVGLEGRASTLGNGPYVAH